jgi:hypothetical protein
MAQSPQQVAIEFEQFWKTYPRKVGKLAAEREYQRARKRASAQQILAGLKRAQFSPEARFQPHPRTWLSQGRYLDEPAPRDNNADAAAREDWFSECQRVHGGACGLSQHRHHLRTLMDAQRSEEA